MNGIDKKNTIYIGIILVVLVITCAFSFTFAFVGGAQGKGNILVSGNIIDASDMIDFMFWGQANLSLNITMDDLSINTGSNNGESFIETSFSGDGASSVDVVISVNQDYFPEGARCYYSILYEADQKFVPSVEAQQNGLKELTILGYNDQTNPVFEYDISNVERAYLLQNIPIEGITNTTPWYFKMRFYNLDVDQNSVIGQNPSGSIVVETGECEKL